MCRGQEPAIVDPTGECRWYRNDDAIALVLGVGGADDDVVESLVDRGDRGPEVDAVVEFCGCMTQRCDRTVDEEILLCSAGGRQRRRDPHLRT